MYYHVVETKTVNVPDATALPVGLVRTNGPLPFVSLVKCLTAGMFSLWSEARRLLSASAAVFKALIIGVIVPIPVFLQLFFEAAML